jgi:predicted RNA-binding Zn-ribbon protein involved in translation (DUF1610 family)
MGIELTGTIELKDITAVEFRCKQCGHATIRKLDGRLRVPISCGNCDSIWQMSESPEALLQFLRNITSHAVKDSPYSLRFHIQGLDEVFTTAARPHP